MLRKAAAGFASLRRLFSVLGRLTKPQQPNRRQFLRAVVIERLAGFASLH
jgi:hypothetical protein